MYMSNLNLLCLLNTSDKVVKLFLVLEFTSCAFLVWERPFVSFAYCCEAF